MRLAAVEQGGEQPLEVPVHRLERGEQADAAFAVEVADRPAQPVDRLLQLLDLGGAFFAFGIEFGELVCGDKIDRSQPFAVGDQPVVRSRFGGGIAHRRTVEPGLLR